MPQQNSGRKVKSHLQMTLALELRARGFSYEKIGQHLSPPVSPPRAWRIVKKGLEFGREKLGETAKNLIQLELNRLNNYRLQLEPKPGEDLDPVTSNALVKIMERECRLTGIDAPTKIAETTPDGSPIQTQEEVPDYSKFSHDELLIFSALHAKGGGRSELGRTHSLLWNRRVCEAVAQRADEVGHCICKGAAVRRRVMEIGARRFDGRLN